MKSAVLRTSVFILHSIKETVFYRAVDICEQRDIAIVSYVVRLSVCDVDRLAYA